MDPFNDDFYEPSRTDLPEHCAYCPNCGTVYLYRPMDDCPTCALAEHAEDTDDSLADLREKVGALYTAMMENGLLAALTDATGREVDGHADE